jgi:aldose 1-epimerase
VQAICRYTLGPGPVLTIDLTATTDRATPVSLTAHPYFNLDGAPDLTHHRLQVMADHYTPLNATGTPTGAIDPVAGTPFDFRSPAAVLHRGAGIDHNFVLGPASGTPRTAAILQSVASGLTMTLATTAPGLQVYDGAFVDVAGPAGRHHGAHAGLCLEPQHYPDAPNIPAFPDAVLRPGQTYRHRMVLSFAADV